MAQLTEKEVRILREMMEDYKEEKKEERAENVEYTKGLIKKWLGFLEEIHSNIVDYKDTHLETKGRPRPCIVWPNGSEIGFGWASHMRTHGDIGGFKVLGFEGYNDFYKLPMEKRNAFLVQAKSIFDKIFKKGELAKIRKSTEKLKDLEKLEAVWEDISARDDLMRAEFKKLAKSTKEQESWKAAGGLR